MDDDRQDRIIIKITLPERYSKPSWAVLLITIALVIGISRLDLLFQLAQYLLTR